jgi:hypothetical protein
MKRWLWDTKRRIYVDASGVKLPKRALAKDLDEYIESISDGMAIQVAEYTAGRISHAALFNFLEREVRLLHAASGTIAYGGLEQMDATKFERIEQRLFQELSYLTQFRNDVAQAAALATPENPLSVEGIANRAGLYAEAAYSEYMVQTVEREADEGVTLGRRICESDGASCDECVAAATEEFIPLDDIEEIGTLQCMNNCRCEIEFSIEGQEFRTSDIFQGVVGGQDQYGGDVTIQ